MTTATEGFSYECLDAFRLPRPDGWERIEAEAGMLAVAHPPVPAGVFRPNLVLRWRPANGVSVARYATAAIASVLEELQDARMLSNDLWSPGAAGTAGQGRAQRFFHRVGQHPVCVDRWIWIAGGFAVEAAASYTIEQHAGMKLLFAQMVRDIRIDEAVLDMPGNPFAGADQPDIDRIAPQEPRLDEDASRWAGAELEDLGSIAAAQSYRERGTLLPIPALELLDTLLTRDRLGRFQRRDPSVATLRAAGLLTAEATLTPAGNEFLMPVRKLDASFQVQACNAAGGSVLQAWIGGGLAKITAEPSLFPAARTAAAAFGPDDLSTGILPATMVPGRIADWVGLSPGWSIPHEPVALSMDQYEARLKSGQTPAPQNMDQAAGRMWRQPWTEWQILDERTGGCFGWVNAGAAGQYRLFPGEEDQDQGHSVRLEPMSPAVVWDILVRFIHASVEGIPLRLPEVPGFNG
ncbi:hypothetical protein [Arthrobacter gengyunqii]|uniref:SMI1/KNR4 family protein n=1 Tax=Arthrobacter gengyunqii TaxID=2886940 RepID=A0ABS8GKX0_9MICC|nr:hypothetical protein [Arthrobacter gengyunqii]MCC3267329.1 hypothetical protein [Arthrobacter gengyunqii]